MRVHFGGSEFWWGDQGVVWVFLCKRLPELFTHTIVWVYWKPPRPQRLTKHLNSTLFSRSHPLTSHPSSWQMLSRLLRVFIRSCCALGNTPTFKSRILAEKTRAAQHQDAIQHPSHRTSNQQSLSARQFLHQDTWAHCSLQIWESCWLWWGDARPPRLQLAFRIHISTRRDCGTRSK